MNRTSVLWRNYSGHHKSELRTQRYIAEQRKKNNTKRSVKWTQK